MAARATQRQARDAGAAGGHRRSGDGGERVGSDDRVVAESLEAQQAPVAIGGWLVGYRFSSDEIARARSEMWGRFADDAS